MNLQIFKSQEQQVTAMVTTIVETIQQSPTHITTIALSGGKSPITLLERLSNADLDFSKLTFTLVDERIVNTIHPDSNEYLIRNHLLKNRAKSAKFIGLADLNKSPEQMVSDINNDPPHIDLAILGMGEDGHTASIFPDCNELLDALKITNPNQYILTHSTSAKYTRISLTLAALSKIPQLILNINGDTKLNVLKESLLGNNSNYPISYVLSTKPTIKIFWSE